MIRSSPHLQTDPARLPGQIVNPVPVPHSLQPCESPYCPCSTPDERQVLKLGKVYGHFPMGPMGPQPAGVTATDKAS